MAAEEYGRPTTLVRRKANGAFVRTIPKINFSQQE